MPFPAPATTRRAVALVVAGAHLVLAMAVDGLSATGTADASIASVGGAFLAPLTHGHYLAVAGSLGLLTAVLWPARVGRAVGLAIVTAVNLHLVVDAETRAVLGASATPALMAGRMTSFPQLLDSVRAEFVLRSGALLASFVLVTSMLLWRRTRDWLLQRAATLLDATLAGSGKRRAVFIASGILTLVAVESTRSDEAVHPLAAVFQSLAQGGRSFEHSPASPLAADNLERLHYDRFHEEGRLGSELAAVRQRIAERGKLPNVLLVILESVGTWQLLVDGKPSIEHTPVLAGLAARGVTFDAVYTTTPLTARSVPLLLTAEPLTPDAVMRGDERFRGKSLPQVLRDRGYRTAFFTGGDLSFDRMITRLGKDSFETIYHAGVATKAEADAAVLNSWGLHDELVFERAAAWLRDAGDEARPWFLQLLTLSTHHPYDLPATELGTRFAAPRGASMRERYEATIRYTDALLGRFLEGMARDRLLDDTVVIVTGDHGEAFGEMHKGIKGHGDRLVDEVTRSFVVIHAPRAPAGGLLLQRVAGLGDLFATIAAFADAPAPRHSQDLLAPQWRSRPVFLAGLIEPISCGLRDGRWKYSGILDGGAAKLFDLFADPHEQTDLAKHHREQVRAYQGLCRDWYRAANMQHVDAPVHGAVDALEWARLEVAGRHGEAAAEASSADLLVVRTQWHAAPDRRELLFRWTRPDGTQQRIRATLAIAQTQHSFAYRNGSGLTPGQWKLEILEDERVVYESNLAVYDSELRSGQRLVDR